MKITCTGPKGEKFEAEGSNRGSFPVSSSLENSDERRAMQKALETWCKVVGADPKTAKEEVHGG